MNGPMSETNLMMLLGGISAMFALTLFLFFRSLMEGRERRLAARLAEADAEADETLVVAADKPMRPLDDFLQHTGLALEPEQAVGWMTLVSVVLATVMYLIQPEWWIGLVGLVLGVAAVWAVLLFHRSRYRSQLQDQLPDTIFLLSRSLRAGLSLEQALALVGDQGVEPLATEFRKVNQKVQFGLSIPLSLELMSKRLKISDFNALVSTVGLYHTTGGNLALLLDRLATATRDHNQFRAFYKSATALGRISAFCIAGAAPLFFVGYSLSDPEFAEFFFKNRVGLSLLLIAGALELIGLFWLWNLIRIDY